MPLLEVAPVTDPEIPRISLDEYVELASDYRESHGALGMWKARQEAIREQLLKAFNDTPGIGTIAGLPSLQFQVVSYYTLDQGRLVKDLPDIFSAYKTKQITQRKLLVLV